MVTLIINNTTLYPVTSQTIKVTRENQQLKDRDAQTMEITLPLANDANARFFATDGRIARHRSATTYSEARLYANGLLVIEGKATITQYTNTSVKVQIKSGVSLSDFSEWADVYIDDTAIAYKDITSLLATNAYNEYFCLPMASSEAGTVNRQGYYWMHNRTFNHAQFNYCPCPRLMYVLQTVLKHIGYTLVSSKLDNRPWNNLYIANTNGTHFLAGCLPHWSIKTFLKEVQKLFNCRLVFNANKRTCTPTWTASLATDGTVKHYTPIDEYSTDYDESGIEYLGASNIEYNLSDNDAWQHPDVGQDILNNYTVLSFDTESDAQTYYLKSQSGSERMCTLYYIRNKDCYAYVNPVTDDDGNVTGTEIAYCGHFQHLTRTTDSDASTVTLNIVPCPCVSDTDGATVFLGRGPGQDSLSGTLPIDREITADIIPHFSVTGNAIADGSTLYGGKYCVASALENSSTAREEAERMEIFFCKGTIITATWSSWLGMSKLNDAANLNSSAASTNYSNIPYSVGILKCFTHAAHSENYSFNPGTLSLQDVDGVPSIGDFHGAGKLIDNQQQAVIKFLSDDLPDPTCIYNFHGKLFLADKIEITISDRGVDRLKTGYFYELAQ